MNGLREILLGQEHLVEEFAQAFEEELQRLRKTRASRTALLTRDLAKVERGIQRCLTFITEGGGAFSHLRASTLWSREQSYGHWLAYLRKQQGIDLRATDPVGRATDQVLGEWHQSMSDPN